VSDNAELGDKCMLCCKVIGQTLDGFIVAIAASVRFQVTFRFAEFYLGPLVIIEKYCKLLQVGERIFCCAHFTLEMAMRNIRLTNKKVSTHYHPIFLHVSGRQVFLWVTSMRRF